MGCGFFGMKLSRRGRYAVTAMLDISLHDGQAPVKLADISRRQSIPLAYLGQLLACLCDHGLLVSARGRSGGYHLASAIDDVDVLQIIRAVDEKTDATLCGGEKNCRAGEPCLTHDLWHSLSRQTEQFLNRISLADLIQRRIPPVDAIAITRMDCVK